MNKAYAAIDATMMLPDPAFAAREHRLVGQHNELAIRLVGAWRWPAMQEHVADLRAMAKQPYTLDVGGQAGPVGYNSIIIDRQADQCSLYDVRGRPTAIFCVHTLEHIEDVELFLWTARRKLHDEGHIVLVTPSYQKEHLAADVWPWHAHTFGLDGDVKAPSGTKRLDTLVAEHWEVVIAEYVEGDCLVVGQG